MKITVDVGTNIDVKKLISPVRNSTFWKFAASEWHRQYKDYVPMRNGVLYNQVVYESDTKSAKITHTAPYAHYQYEGIVYGPNIPIVNGDAVEGYYSPPNRPKRPTVRMLKYSRELHPKASRKWDKAAEPTQKPKLIKALDDYLKKENFNG